MKILVAHYFFSIYSIEVPDLYWTTFVVNFLGLVLALWLGLYLVTRNSKYWIAWLTAFTLWSMAGLFLNILLAINPPPQEIYRFDWMRFMFPFWPTESLAGSANSWLQGWSVTPAVAFWHNVTILMRPGRLTLWRWTRILTGYFLAVLAIVVQAKAPILFAAQDSNPLYLNSMKPGVWYPFFGTALIVLTGACVLNLIRSARFAQVRILRKQLLFMAAATLIAGLTGPLSFVSSAMGFPVPIVGMSLLLAVPVVVIGVGVVRYSALMAGRTIQHDFFYNLAGLVLIMLVYGLASWILVQVYRAPAVVMILIPVLAVVTHSLMIPMFRLLDHLFYHTETRQLRSNLQRLVRQVGEGSGLEENLGRALETLCSSVQATYGLIITFEQASLHLAAAYQWQQDEPSVRMDEVSADDVVQLSPGQFQPPLEEAALLVPLYGGAEQLGALILGRPVNGLRYAVEDVESLLAPTDRIAELISIAHRKADNLARIAQLAEDQPAPAVDQVHPIHVDTVETALRNLNDYAFLGDTSLAHLKLVNSRLAQGQVTHLERGKQVHAILVEAIDKLRPDETPLRDPPPPEWYPYSILKDAYVEERPNRDIMLDLYISEGTFNRTRRAAIRSVARALGEMESTFAWQIDF
jgi:hypothetical protein